MKFIFFFLIFLSLSAFEKAKALEIYRVKEKEYHEKKISLSELKEAYSLYESLPEIPPQLYYSGSLLTELNWGELKSSLKGFLTVHGNIDRSLSKNGKPPQKVLIKKTLSFEGNLNFEPHFKPWEIILHGKSLNP